MQLEPGKGVKVTMTIYKSIQLPVGTVASLQSFDLLGTKMIRLDLGPGPGVLPKKSLLLTTHEGGIVDNVTAELTPRLRELKSTISAFDTTLASVNSMVDARNQREIAEALHAINVTAKNLAEMTESLKKETVAVSAILKNTNSITANLARNNDTINHILSNVNGLTKQINNAPIQKTLEELRATISEVRGIADKINNNQGSLGMLINNKEVYNNLNNSLKSLDSLERDLKAHPSRYINVTIFGKAKKS
jgi:phospholipid/cholesterol/gamma-HCH transport system substrate-binding protein